MADKYSRRKGKNTMAHWRKSYDFSLSFDENELDSSDESESDENVEAIKLYHRRKSTAIAVRARYCIKEGFLMKQSGSFQRWKKRYFKLKEGKKLFYAKDSSDSIFNEVDLQDLSVAESSIKNVNNSFTVITPFRSLILCAENRKEMEEWISSLKSVDSRQTSQSELMDVVSGSHNWYSCSHAGRPTFCNVCRDLLSGVTSKGLSCEVCKFKVHKRCAVRAPNKCKWTTFQSVKRCCYNVTLDELDPMAMPHQWLEGNLPPGVKCAVCNIPCGSKRRLQDWNCLWCNSAVHSSCRDLMPNKCSLGENAYSVLPPLAIKAPVGHSSLDTAAYKLAPRCSGSMPLLVFVNSKSGDNQGVKFIRKFKQLFNPLQVFDLGVGGPSEGLKLFQSLDQFRILICGGDGSVGWVMNEVDRLKISKKCQLGVLPLGTGNDLSRVLGWGTTVDDDSAMPQYLQHLERAKKEMLDRWSIMVQEGTPMTGNNSQSSSNEMLDSLPYRQEVDNIDVFENSVATHLTRILHSSQHAVVISSAKVLCETVKNFVAKVGEASANSDPDGVEGPDSLEHKCTTLNDKLNQLLQTLSIESEALPTPAKEDLHSESSESSSGSGPNNNGANNGKQKVFVPRDALMSRANSLKKALKQIIEHTEKAVDEQNAQSGVASSLAEAIVTAATTAASGVMTTSNLTGVRETGEELFDRNYGDNEASLYPTNNNDNRKIEKNERWLIKDSDRKASIKSRCISRGSSHPYHFEPPIEEKLLASTGKGTIQFNGCIIARAFLKERNTEGLVGSLIGKALLANADALCAPVTPMMDDFLDVEGYTEKCIMNNYFGIGLDAKITLDFHLKREEHPEKHRSRTRNMLWYGVLGGKEIVQRTYKNLDQRVHLECDGHKINLPSLQGIVVLNIPSYMGGANFWGTRRDDGFTGPSFDDNILEVVAVLGAHQMGMSKVFGGMQNHRIAQCRAVKITIKGEPVPVQVDGEAWIQPPGYIKIVHKNRAQMLVRDREFETTLREWEKEKNLPVTELEGDSLRPLADCLLKLVKFVKEACCANPVIEQDLYSVATSASAAIEKVFPDGCLHESASRTKLQDFVTTAKAFTQDVVWFLHEKAPSLIPPLSPVLENRLATCVSSLEPELVKAIELYCPTTITDEEVEKQQSKGKSKFKFGFRLKKPEIVKSSTAPAGRMIQFWGVDEVGQWLENIGLPEYKELFARHDIRGTELLGLDRPDLKDLGVDKVGHVKRIMSGIKALCGGVSPRTASRIERTTKAEEKTGRVSPSFEREDSH